MINVPHKLGSMMQRTLFDETHELFRKSFRRFVESEIVPHHPQWERDGIIDKAMYRKAGALGFLGMSVPVEWGGGGVDDFRFNVVITEEISRAGVYSSGSGMALHNDLCLPYFMSGAREERKAAWLSGICSGELMTAVAMTEPETGSDLAAIRTTAVRDGEHYILNGSKIFISGGIHSDLIIVACKTDAAARHGGMSLLVVEAGMEGFYPCRSTSCST